MMQLKLSWSSRWITCPTPAMFCPHLGRLGSTEWVPPELIQKLMISSCFVNPPQLQAQNAVNRAEMGELGWAGGFA